MKSISSLDAVRIRNQRQFLGNPLRGLTPQGLSSQLDSFAAGDLRNAAQTWEIMERRNPVLGSVARKRYKSISRLDWQVIATDDSPEAAAHAEVLKQFWDGIRVTDAMERNRRGGVGMLLYQAAHCIGHRFAVHEIVWDPQPGNLSATFTRVPLWFFENRTGELQYMESDYAMSGTPLDEGGWLVTCGDGLLEATSILVSQIGLGLGDWLSYSEKYGIPGMAWKTPSKPGSDEWREVEAAAAAFSSDFACVMPVGTDIQPITPGNSGPLPQQAVVEYLERRIVTLWRGADLGTMSQGGGGVGASLQGDETEILAEDDVMSLAEALQQQVERHVIGWHFGTGVEPLAYFSIILPKAEASYVDLAVDKFLVESGVPLAVADAAERYGRQMAEDGKPQLTAPAPGSAPGPALALANTAPDPADEFAEAMAGVFAPIRDRLTAIETIQDPEERYEQLQALRAELPRLLKGAKNSKAEAALSRILGTAMSRGLLTRPGA